MVKTKDITAFTLSGFTVFVLVTLRYVLMFINVMILILLVLASISFIGFNLDKHLNPLI